MEMNTKAGRQKSAEAQTPKAPSEEDFVGLAAYIQERNDNINRFSDKLRTNLIEFADKIENKTGITITDTEPYLDETTEGDIAHGFTTKSYLRLEPQGNLITVVINSMEDGDPTTTKEKEWFFRHIPREDLKAIITSGRIPKFLRYAAAVLAEKEAEFEQVADIAEKINQAIKEE